MIIDMMLMMAMCFPTQETTWLWLWVRNDLWYEQMVNYDGNVLSNKIQASNKVGAAFGQRCWEGDALDW